MPCSIEATSSSSVDSSLLLLRSRPRVLALPCVTLAGRRALEAVAAPDRDGATAGVDSAPSSWGMSTRGTAAVRGGGVLTVCCRCVLGDPGEAGPAARCGSLADNRTLWDSPASACLRSTERRRLRSACSSVADAAPAAELGGGAVADCGLARPSTWRETGVMGDGKRERRGGKRRREAS